MIQEANLHWRYFDTATNLIYPWYTLPCLEWLIQQDAKDWSVFEYGCGYSSIWWRANSRFVYSVDHDETWGYAMGACCRSGKLEYITHIEGTVQLWKEEPSPYDCIVVDGEYRDECVNFCRQFLKSGGYMIVDNYGQDGFPSTEVIDSLLEGWEKQVFKQPNHSQWTTAVFRKP